MKLKYLLLLYATMLLYGKEEILVKITPQLSSIETIDHGKKIAIERIQDPDNRLTDDFTKTSRPCPPFCIQPITPVKGVRTIEELELLDFIQTKVPTGEGILIDARLKNWYEAETIPGAVNIPFTIFNTIDDTKKLEHFFSLLGVKVKEDGHFDFKEAKLLAVFCNGVWCEQSPHFIRSIIKYGYPKEKIYYYRSGFQGWKLLGLTTVIHQPNSAQAKGK